MAITTFVESLNHICKYGLSNTADYRWLAGFAMISVEFVSLCFKCLLVFMPNYNWFLLCCHFFRLMALLVLYTRPCKSTMTNISLSFYFTLFGMCGLAAYLCHYDKTLSNEPIHLMFFLLQFPVKFPLQSLWGLYNLLLSYMLPHRLQQLSHNAHHFLAIIISHYNS